MNIDNKRKLETSDQKPVNEGRRKILTASSLLMAAGLLWKPQPVAAREGRGRGGHLVLDVACLGDTFAPNFNGALDQGSGDLRGTSFYVEGLIYPAGTIMPGTEFDLQSAPAMGHWFCRGWFTTFPDRPEPGVITSQEYLLDFITPETLSPEDTLASSGVENAGLGLPAVRAVIGGTGRYRDARGEVVQETVGTNTSVLNVFDVPAPTFSFHFTFNMGEGRDEDW